MDTGQSLCVCCGLVGGVTDKTVGLFQEATQAPRPTQNRFAVLCMAAVQPLLFSPIATLTPPVPHLLQYHNVRCLLAASVTSALCRCPEGVMAQKRGASSPKTRRNRFSELHLSALREGVDVYVRICVCLQGS